MSEIYRNRFGTADTVPKTRQGKNHVEEPVI